ncbi:DUF6653 family protein [Halonotius roseus]|uniref:Uncharacterized protein n=1 Tax=Halonotius roseus TaxID=2511997 RepID=A0A544QMP0_9EURY|nr:DUF6653 family protein [Halonotius roseus]TQQ80183.1 hypothetical protein EWF95_06715 [Halonotius roseus]
MVSRDDLEATFWERHANPKSGWSRLLITPALLAAIYHRNPRLAAAAIGYAVVNPVLFSPPEDTDAWMSRVVLAERWWTQEHSVISLGYPNVLNVCNLGVTAYAVAAAAWKQPVRTAVAGVASMLLKLWYVAALVRRYDAARADGS